MCTTDLSANVYQLNSNSNKTGLGIALKVMAGDKIKVFGKSYYYQNNPGSGSNSYVELENLLSSFLSTPTGAAAGVHGATGSSLNNPNHTAGITAMMQQQSSQNAAAPDKPRAFVNVIFFDEQLKSYDYRVRMVGEDRELKNHFEDLQNLLANKSGYVYIYCSNESPVNVFFDNLQVTHERGAILEETHYYPFGLTMKGISSIAAIGSVYPSNKKKYNGIEEMTDLGLNQADAFFRTLDLQTGRWWQIDPEIDAMESYSPYASMFDNPILNSDFLGNVPLAANCCPDWLESAATTLVATAAVVVDNVFGTNSTGLIADKGYVPSSQNQTWNNAVTTANRASQTVGLLSTLTGGLMVGGSTVAMAGSGGGASPVALPIGVAGLGVIALGSQLTMNSTENLVTGNGLIRDQNTTSNTPATKTTKKDRVADQKPGERALNQSEGINSAQAGAAKSKAPGQKKQTRINSTRKSDDNLKRQLKEVKSLKDAFENFGS